MIAVVDYHKGNLKSVERGLVFAGGDARITDDPAKITQASAIVLPGVGAFADAAETMRELGQADVIRERVQAGVPFLGICLGEHLMFEEGEEGEVATGEDEEPQRPRGLGILPGVVGRLPKFDAEGNAHKIPHVGWNSVCFDGQQACSVAQTVLGSRESATGAFGSCGTRLVSMPADLRGQVTFSSSPSSSSPSPLFENIADGEYFYFTHSYAAPEGPFVIARTTHSTAFPCAVQYGPVAFGVQFHPEKSSDAGAQLLRNFVGIAKEA